MESEQFSTCMSGWRAAVFRHWPISGGAVANITSAPSATARSISPEASCPLSGAYILTFIWSPSWLSRYCLPRSCVPVHWLLSGRNACTNATLRWSGRGSMMRESSPRRAASSSGSGGSVSTAMGWASCSRRISAQTDSMLLVSSAASMGFMSDSLYTLSHTSRASASVTASFSRFSLRNTSRKRV